MYVYILSVCVCVFVCMYVGPETLALEHMPAGFYDVWVHSYTKQQFDGDEFVSVRLASGNGRTRVTYRTVNVSPRRQAAAGPIWWHIGYINRTQVGNSDDFVSEFVQLNVYSSSPKDSGCRIYRPQDTLVFAANASGGGARLASGISVTVAPGALSMRRAEAPALEMSVTQLLLPPVGPPVPKQILKRTVHRDFLFSKCISSLTFEFFLKAEGNAKFGAPVVYLEPSGTKFNPPGVNVSMPLDPHLSSVSPQRAAVFRLEGSSWREIIHIAMISLREKKSSL